MHFSRFSPLLSSFAPYSYLICPPVILLSPISDKPLNQALFYPKKGY